MFGIFRRKPKPKADQVLQRVFGGLKLDAQAIGRAQLYCNQSMFELYGSDFGRSRKIYALSLALTAFFVERYWGKAASMVMSDVEDNTRASVHASPDRFTGVDEEAVQMRKHTDHLLRGLIESDFGIGPVTGFCDMLASNIGAPYMRGSDVLTAVELAKIISSLEATIFKTSKAAEDSSL